MAAARLRVFASGSVCFDQDGPRVQHLYGTGNMQGWGNWKVAMGSMGHGDMDGGRREGEAGHWATRTVLSLSYKLSLPPLEETIISSQRGTDRHRHCRKEQACVERCGCHFLLYNISNSSLPLPPSLSVALDPVHLGTQIHQLRLHLIQLRSGTDI